MYIPILVTACLASVIVLTVVLTSYTSNVKKDFDKKMRSVVDQVNTSQYYQYELEKKSYDKLNNLDNNMTNVRSKYTPRDEIKERVVTKTLDSQTVKANTANVNSIKFTNGVTMQNTAKNVDVNLPPGSTLNVKNPAGKPVLTADNNRMNANEAKLNKLQLGDKFMLSGVGDAHGNDGWLRMFDKNGKDYHGGIAMGNLWVKDNSHLNGRTQVNGSLNINGQLNAKGGSSEHNPQNWDTHFPWAGDKKNYIRGDTEMRGNVNAIGDINVNRHLNVKGNTSVNNLTAKNVKLGHNWGGSWFDQSPLTVHSPGIGASFGNQYYSHFSWSDGNTYIRPGVTGGSIVIGDIGNTAKVQLGDKNTTTNVGGNLCVKDTCFTQEDLIKMKSTADNNLLQLQAALQEKLDKAQKEIQLLATQRANEQIAVYKSEQQIRQKSLQEQIDQLNVAIGSIKQKVGI